MNETQKTYLLAKAAFEAAQEAARREKPPFSGRGATDEEIEAYIEIEMEIEDRHGVWELFDLMLEARDAMLAWAKAKVARDCAAEPRLDEALSVFDRARKYPAIMDKLIDAALRLKD